MNAFRFCFFIGLCVLSSVNYAWNAQGHRLIAQIAYDQLTPHARLLYNHYNHSLDKLYPRLSWVNSAVWLDWIRYKKMDQYNALHYIDIPFSDEGMPLPKVPQENAVTGIQQSFLVLKNKHASDVEKGLALRILLHVVGDIHQPLHAVTRVSREFPEGDRGGGLVPIYHQNSLTNLHAYWDKGAGFLSKNYNKRSKRHGIEKTAKQIEKMYPCHRVMITEDAMKWAIESHQLAVKKAYGMLIHNRADKPYGAEVRRCTKERIALAGCRLGALLNQLA